MPLKLGRTSSILTDFPGITMLTQLMSFRQHDRSFIITLYYILLHFITSMTKGKMSQQDTPITQPDEYTISPSQQIHPLRNTHFAENLCWVPLILVGGSGWGVTKVSCQLKYCPFVSCQLKFGPFVSCQ